MKHIWKVFADVAVSPESDLTASALFAVFIFVIIAAIVGVIVFFVMKSRKRKASPCRYAAARSPNAVRNADGSVARTHRSKSAK